MFLNKRERPSNSDANATAAEKLSTIVIDAPGSSQVKDVAALQPSTVEWQTLDQARGIKQRGLILTTALHLYRGSKPELAMGPSCCRCSGCCGTWTKPPPVQLRVQLSQYSMRNRPYTRTLPSIDRVQRDIPWIHLSCSWRLLNQRMGLPNVQSAHVLQADGFAMKLQASQIAQMVRTANRARNRDSCGCSRNYNYRPDRGGRAGLSQGLRAGIPGPVRRWVSR